MVHCRPARLRSFRRQNWGVWRPWRNQGMTRILTKLRDAASRPRPLSTVLDRMGKGGTALCDLSAIDTRLCRQHVQHVQRPCSFSNECAGLAGWPVGWQERLCATTRQRDWASGEKMPGSLSVRSCCFHPKPRNSGAGKPPSFWDDRRRQTVPAAPLRAAASGGVSLGRRPRLHDVTVITKDHRPHSWPALARPRSLVSPPLGRHPIVSRHQRSSQLVSVRL